MRASASLKAAGKGASRCAVRRSRASVHAPVVSQTARIAAPAHRIRRARDVMDHAVEAAAATAGENWASTSIPCGAIDGSSDRHVTREPRLTEWQKEADDQERSPTGERDPRLADSKCHGERRACADDERQLQAVGEDVAQHNRGRHRFFPIIRVISCRSASESRSSSMRCVTSGWAEPLNTRSTNSRTMALMTCCLGLAGW